MSALTKLAEFVHKLPDNLQPEFRQLVDAVTNERDRLQNERLATLQATTGTFDVVAIAGTAEQLLNAINVGDTVELNPYVEPTESDNEYLRKDKDVIKPLNTVTNKETFSDGINIKVNKASYWHRIELFRKVSTPLSHPHQTVEGC